MKVKSFKTKTNNGITCKTEVVLIEADQFNEEDAIIIQTTRVIPRSEFKGYSNLNNRFPTYFVIKKTENYAYIITRSAPVKLSTFLKINETVNELIKL